MRFLILLIFLPLACYTSIKLYHMAQVREWLPGAKVVACVVTKKWTTLSVGEYSSEDIFHIGWDTSEYPALSNKQTNIPEPIWRSLQVGDPVEIVYLGNSRVPYLRHDDIWASNGSIGFDLCLLVIWLSIAGYQIYRIARYKDY